METNSRGFQFTPFFGEHVSVKELRTRPETRHNKYLNKQIPPYPRPELHVTHLSHSTDQRGLWGIKKDQGFRDPYNHDGLRVAWFFLTVTPADLRDAEDRDMKIVHPDETEEDFRPGTIPDPLNQDVTRETEEAGPEEARAGPEEAWGGPKEAWGGPEEAWGGPEEARGGTEEARGGPEEAQGGVLQSFATSPAFSSKSRYGSYRFTFSLRDVLDKYSRQFCGGQEPVMRKWKTVLYKKEVMYVVLVHSPTNQERFSVFPLLSTNQEADPICEFREDPPHFIWRPQAMSETHRCEVRLNRGRLEVQELCGHWWYVWDHVALALHLDQKVLRFGSPRLRWSVRYCERDYPTVVRPWRFQTQEEAESEVHNTWWWLPPRPLEEFSKSEYALPQEEEEEEEEER